MSELDCEKCGCKLHLMHDDMFIKLESGENIAFENMPFLVCGGCQKKYVPDRPSHLIRKLLGEYQIIREGQTEILYDFKKIKNKYFNDKFIAEKVKFLYDKDDYYFIPGLVRKHNTGFLTPVFFNIEVLLKYIHHPQYGLDIGADTLGYIYKEDKHCISFGINENNKVIMWLGDIIDLNVEEQFYLRSENVPSDHSIGSEFYEAQIEVQWAEASAERKLLKKRLDFNEKVRNDCNLVIAQLDTETLRVAKNIRKLLVNTNDAFKDLIIPLNELFVEAINNKGISKDLKEKFPDLKEELKGKKGIKLLQLWLEKNTKGIDVCAVIAPLFVLYDFRLVSAHLYSDDQREKKLKSCCTRLGLAEDERDYIVIANTLISKLDEMYENFIQCLTSVDERGENGVE